jgi:signal transduction histidine kinase
LARLERAANGLGSDLRGEPLPEDGPQEVARVATAFNAMQRRIAEQVAERIQILAAISHDLQTPITRMRLRADFLGDSDAKEKLQGDLQEMQTLVKQGLALAREYDDIGSPPAAHVAVEASREPS